MCTVFISFRSAILLRVLVGEDFAGAGDVTVGGSATGFLLLLLLRLRSGFRDDEELAGVVKLNLKIIGDSLGDVIGVVTGDGCVIRSFAADDFLVDLFFIFSFQMKG